MSISNHFSSVIRCILIAGMVMCFSSSVIAQEKKQEKTKEKKGEVVETKETQKPDIKEVPKSRKQPKPSVVKPNVKVKPVKIVKPKIRKP
ncbi:hypothetical protein [Pedobacter frigoris]|uniref:Uncharacterized protein n=1 Tax=Pedobacter frigoris TaxID=2571272 RepID=A0A4U1CH14_9SPHI|nr:hypothetical protein [Pedobacter frigoris]TKC06055.1 hypothetical protein FA047_12030 [Pedobacter frigoris]